MHLNVCQLKSFLLACLSEFLSRFLFESRNVCKRAYSWPSDIFFNVRSVGWLKGRHSLKSVTLDLKETRGINSTYVASEESKWRENRVSRKIAGILLSEYEPLNKYCYYSLLDTYQLIHGQGTLRAKVLPLWGQQKNKPRIVTWARGKPFWFANWPWQIFLPWTWNWYKLRETCKWNTKFRLEIPTGKAGPPF